MTRLLILSDMDGISGIECYEQVNRSHPSYAEGVRLLCHEVNVIAAAALESGAQSVSVIDAHGGGGNLQPEQLDNRVEIVPEDLSPGFDLAFLVGCHPRAGDLSGFISHTMTPGVAIEVDGSEIGEITLFSWWIGEHGIPVGLVTGDRAGTDEAVRFFPDVLTHTVKHAESWSRAVCVPVEQSYEALGNQVRQVLEQPGRWKVYPPPSPLPFRLLLQDESAIVPLIPWLEQGDDGWLSGQVDQARDLIDLMDVVSSLLGYEYRMEQIARLSADPTFRETIREYQLDQIDQDTKRERWVIDR